MTTACRKGRSFRARDQIPSDETSPNNYDDQEENTRAGGSLPSGATAGLPVKCEQAARARFRWRPRTESCYAPGFSRDAPGAKIIAGDLHRGSLGMLSPAAPVQWGGDRVAEEIGDVLRGIVVAQGNSIIDDPRRLRAMLKDLAASHPGQISLLLSAVDAQVPHKLLDSGGTPVPLLEARLVEDLEKTMFLTGSAARWAVQAWAFALDLRLACPRALGSQPPGEPSPAAAAPAVTPGPGLTSAETRIRIARLLSAALAAASQPETDKPTQLRALAYVANTLAAIDPDRAIQVFDDVKRIAWSLDEVDRALAEIEIYMAVTDPDGAVRLARSFTRPVDKVPALINVARLLAATDPDRAARLFDEADHLTSSIAGSPNASWETLMLLKGLAAAGPGRAEQVLDKAEHFARSVSLQDRAEIARKLAPADPARAERLVRSIAREDYEQNSRVGNDVVCVLAVNACALAAVDPGRARPLLDEAERLARSLPHGLGVLAAEITGTDPDRAERLVGENMDRYGSEAAETSAQRLAKIASVVAAADPGRASRLLDDAERLAQYVTFEGSLSFIAQDMAAIDPERALRICWRITEGRRKVDAIIAAARTLATTDRNRAVRLLQDAERLLEPEKTDWWKAYRLAHIAEAWKECNLRLLQTCPAFHSIVTVVVYSEVRSVSAGPRTRAPIPRMTSAASLASAPPD